MNARATAFLFPGLNSMRRAQDFLPLLQLPGFGERWREVCTAFAAVPGFAAFDGALRAGDTRTLYRREHLHLLALAAATLQTATAAALEDAGEHADWVCGYSIGDVARTLHAGAAEFAQLVAFARALPQPLPSTDDTTGMTLMVVSPPVVADAERGRAILARSGLAVCPLSPRVTMLSGAGSAVAATVASLRPIGWRCRTLVDCALHAGERAPLATVLGTALAGVPLRSPRLAVFSSVYVRPLTNATGLRAELTANVAVRYDFAAAMEELRRRHGVVRFVDVGPCHVTASLLRHFEPPLQAETALDLLSDRIPRASR